MLVMLLVGCTSSPPSRSEAAEIIQKTGVVYLSRPVQAKLEVGHFKPTCGEDHKSVTYALFEERGFITKTSTGDISLTDKGRGMLNRLKVTPYYQGHENGCNYQSYLLPLGEKNGVEVTGLTQPTGTTLVAKYAFVVELNELGKELVSGSPFCKSYLEKPGNGGMCPDLDLPQLQPVAGKDGFATVGEEEATLTKFDDGWRIR